MNAVELLAELKERGVQATSEGQLLSLKPRSALTEDLIEELKAHKAEVLSLLEVTEICAMPLEEFAQAGLRVVVSSKVLGEEVLFASDNATVDPGERRVVYRAAELQAILGADPEDLCSIHAAKKVFGASVIPC